MAGAKLWACCRLRCVGLTLGKAEAGLCNCLWESQNCVKHPLARVSIHRLACMSGPLRNPIGAHHTAGDSSGPERVAPSPPHSRVEYQASPSASSAVATAT